MYIRRVGEDERVYKWSKYWHISVWIYWFFVHFFRIIAYYGWCVQAFETLTLVDNSARKNHFILLLCRFVDSDSQAMVLLFLQS